VTSHDRSKKNGIMTMTNGTSPYSTATQIFCNG